MKFIELVLENFGPYFGRQVINLDTNTEDNSHPIILLGGMNGGGKTTLMDAIRLALYGPRAECSTRGNLSYGDFLTQCVHNQAAFTDKTRIELVFEHVENDQLVKYRIVRTWEKNPKDGKDNLGILDSHDWLDTGLINIWDEYIENLLPQGISNLFLFDGEQVKELAEQESPTDVVVEAINALLGLELAEKLTVDVEVLTNRKRKEIADNKELVNLKNIEENIHKLQLNYDQTKENLASVQKKLEKAEKIQEDALDKFISEGGKMASERTQLEQQRQQIKKETENTRSHLIKMTEGTLSLSLIKPLLSQAHIQAEKEIHNYRRKIAYDILVKRDKRLLDWIYQTNIEKTKVEEIQSFLNQDTENLYGESLKNEESWLEVDEETLNILENMMTYKLPNTKNSTQQLLEILQSQEEKIVSLERQIQTAASPEDYEILQNTLKQAQNATSKLKAEEEIYQRRLNELISDIDKLKKDLSDYSLTAFERKNDEHIILTSTQVLKTLKLFREKLTLKKLHKLEVEVTECFRYLLHKSNLIHCITIDTNTFKLSLYDSQGQEVHKHRLSAGEKQLLAIAFLWGLARVSGRRLPIAIDTPLGRLDSSHRKNLVERYFPSASHQVILISTDTEIGKKEVESLRKSKTIAREYLLKHDTSQGQTTVESGYFW
jgi:DNA sulfur modification protein DndD